VAVHNSVFYFTNAASQVLVAGLDQYELTDKNGAPMLISSIVAEIYSRMRTVGCAITSVDEINIFNSAAGANVFVGTAPNPTLTGALPGHVASAYVMLVFAAANRQKTRITGFEAADARPQRYPGSPVPVTDNGSTEWYVIRSPAPFATQDGFPVTQYKSFNTGYNRRLARAYGRILQP